MNRFLLFTFAAMIISCSSDSGNDTANPQTAAHDVETQNLDYNTYKGLLAEEPCDDEMNGVVAHIKEENTEYVCFCEKEGVCRWNALKSSLEPKMSSGALIDVDFSSSSVQMGIFSSSDQMQSVAELNGTSCLSEVYGASPAMEYIAQGMIIPIEGTSTSIKCMRNAADDWVWMIVENADLIKSSSSNSFVFGEFTDPRDGQVYKTIGVKYSDDIETNGGEEVWFAEDLRYCPQCNEPPDSSMLYTWQEAMKSGCTFGKTCTMSYDVQGLCPDGWLILPMNKLVIQIGNEVVMEKLVESGTSYWDTKIDNETSDVYPVCERQCSIYDCVPYYDPQIFTRIYYTEVVDGIGLECAWKAVHNNDCDLESEAKFQFTRHRLRCYKKGKVPSSQTTVGICWSKYDGYTTQNICDIEKKLGL